MITTMTETLYEYTFRCPVRGRCESDYSVFDNGYEDSAHFDAHDMWNIFDANSYDFQEALGGDNELTKDILEYDDRIRDFLEKVTFLEFTRGDDNELVLIIECLTNKEVDKQEEENLKNYINGQLSDGWGEGFEQRVVMSETFDYNRTVWDEYSFQFDTETENGHADWYVSFDRVYDDLSFEGTKEETRNIGEVVMQLTEFFPLSGSLTKKSILRFDNLNDFKNFCKINNEMSLLDLFTEDDLDPNDLIYFGSVCNRLQDEDNMIAYPSKGSPCGFNLQMNGEFKENLTFDEFCREFFF